MDMTSHLLAALNLPPIRDVAPFPATDPQSRDRPLPLEPSASQDAYSATQYNQGRREHSKPPHQQTTTQSNTPSASPQEQPRQDTQDGTGDVVVVQQNAPKGSRTFPPILPSGTPTADKGKSQGKTSGRRTSSGSTSSTPRRMRRRWTEEETNDLIKGCHIHGIGNWKKVLDDPRFRFNGRSSVDLKDRFRTCFPKEYKKESAPESDNSDQDPQTQPDSDTIVVASPSNIPNAGNDEKRKKKNATKTSLHHAGVLQKLGIDGNFPKVQRRVRREFTSEEDIRLLKGFETHGASWSRIQNDPSLQLSHRRSTDLRDRFRNAFPDRYESAGFKARPRQRPKPHRSSNLLTQVKNSTSGAQESANQESANQESANQDGEGRLESNATNKGDSSALLMQSLLAEHISPSWAAHEHGIRQSDQSPAPGSLALDPALNDGFEGSTLEHITEQFLAVANAEKEPHEESTDIVRWEEMATHPIFDIDPSMTSGVQHHSGSGGGSRNTKQDRKREGEDFEARAKRHRMLGGLRMQ